MNKKLFLSLALIAIIAGAAFAGTFAFFTATRTVEDVSFITGTLDLNVEDGIIQGQTINVGNLGSDGNYAMAGEQDWQIINTGSMAGRLYVELENIENINRGCNEPKMIARGSESMEACELEGGLLGNAVNFVVLLNGEELFTTNLSTNSEEEFKNIWSNLDPIILQSTEETDESLNLTINWFTVPGEYGNEIQNDELKFNIRFTLTQLLENES